MFHLNTTTNRQLNLSATFVRVLTGFTFAMHGWQKVFEIGIPGITQGFTQMGIPLPGVAAPFISWLELTGGIALALGLLTRGVALALAIDMLVAMLVVHLPNGFFAPKGVELAFLLMMGSMSSVIAGGGVYSLDNVAWRRRSHHFATT